jgi:hypothetical protein
MSDDEPVKGDNEVAAQFVRRFFWQKGRPAILQTIHPETGAIRAYTFQPGDEDGLRKFLLRFNGVENIYFQVNPLKRALSGKDKAKKSDVAAIRWLQVDMDPSPLEDFNRERARILKALETFDPKPNLIIDSGGGYQAFWAIAEKK